MSRITSSLPVAAAAIVAATMIAACGSSSSNASSSSSADGPSTPAQRQQMEHAAVAFADCMRSHGVADFPDPGTARREFKNALETKSPAFHTAEMACGHLLPGGGPHESTSPPSQAQIAEELAFARCVRSHGFPSFPDPTSDGQLTHEMIDAAGINLHQPAVLQAGDACVGVTHGLLTKAAVARFVAGR